MKIYQPIQKSVTLIGLVLPASWDENGEVTALKIAAFDETEYAIVDDATGRELFQYLRRTVFARGRLTGGKSDPKALKVFSFYLMKKGLP